MASTNSDDRDEDEADDEIALMELAKKLRNQAIKHNQAKTAKKKQIKEAKKATEKTTGQRL